MLTEIYSYIKLLLQKEYINVGQKIPLDLTDPTHVKQKKIRRKQINICLLKEQSEQTEQSEQSEKYLEIASS